MPKTHEIETSKQKSTEFKETKSWFYEKFSNIEKPLAKVIKRYREKIQK